MAELEVRDHQLEADKVKAEEALRKKKRGKELGRCLLSPFCTILSLTCCCLELEACTKANKKLQKLWEVAEAREAATKEKLRLEQQARRGMIRKSYDYLFSVVSLAWADQAGCFF